MPVSLDENVGAVVQCSGPIRVCGGMSNYWSGCCVGSSLKNCQSRELLGDRPSLFPSS